MQNTLILKIQPINDVAKELYKEQNYLWEENYLLRNAGYDLYICEDTIIPSGKTILVGLGIKCEANFHTENGYIPSGFLMYSRSSIYKTPLILHNSVGVIDSGYRGELKAPLRNLSNEDFTVKKGERYVQIVASNMLSIIVNIVDKLSITERGTDGFGSTGK